MDQLIPLAAVLLPKIEMELILKNEPEHISLLFFQTALK
jgi:hypothetical protein